MALVTFPTTPSPSTMTLRLVQPGQVTRSEWTGKTKRQASGRGWWLASLQFPPMEDLAARSFRVFLAVAKGRANTFQVPVTQAAQSAATPLVDGATQTGTTLVTDTWGASHAIKAGWFITIGGQLLQITTDVTANGSGQATITFAPALRSSPANNAAIEVVNPYMTASLVEEDYGFSIEVDTGHSFAFDVEESF